MSNGMILTNAGRELLSLALEGKELHFTRGALGDGNSPADARKLTALVSERKTLSIQSIRTNTTGTCECVLNISNVGQASGFWLREYGLFATHPTTGKEVLYSYCNKGAEAGYLEGYDGANPINFALTLLTVIDQAPNITATITTTNNYVTESRLEGRVQDIFAKSKDIEGVWIYGKNTEQRLSPISWKDFKLSLIGVTDIESLSARLERLEDNMGETLLRLEMKDLHPDFANYLVEDFKNLEKVDSFKCKVDSIVAGDDSLDCSPIAGIYPGSWYTITDGLKSESVQVHSVNIENGIQRIILEQTIQNTYNIETCHMYRTTAGLELGCATGAGVRKAITWRPSFEWVGVRSGVERVSELDMTLGNGRSYKLQGDCEVTFSGALTLSL